MVRQIPGFDAEEIFEEFREQLTEGILFKPIRNQYDPDNLTSGNTSLHYQYQFFGIFESETEARTEPALTTTGEAIIRILRGGIQGHNQGVAPEVNDMIRFFDRDYTIKEVKPDDAGAISYLAVCDYAKITAPTVVPRDGSFDSSFDNSFDIGQPQQPGS